MSTDDDVDPALPVAFVAKGNKRTDDELRPHTFEELKGEHVHVRASGFSYRGTLVGADEAELYLRSETRWIVLPLDRVTSVERERLSDRPLGGAAELADALSNDEGSGA